MHFLKKLILQLTGYWVYKANYLPIGADVFVDIERKAGYPNLPVIFDVGANTGQTIAWVRSYQKKSLIYSFEPVAKTFQQLQEAAAGDKKCVLEKMALGDVAGEQVIRLYSDDRSELNSLKDTAMNQAQHASTETIVVDTLDHYCAVNNITKIDLLKIDTEGFELNVLKGAETALANGRISFIYCEVGFQQQNGRNTYFPQLTEYLEAYNYLFFGLYKCDYFDWKRGGHFGNALYIHRAAFQRMR